MSQDMLDHWIQFIEHPSLDNKLLALATFSSIEPRKGVWALLATAYWEVSHRGTLLLTEEKEFLEQVRVLLEQHLSPSSVEPFLKAANVLDFTRTQAIGIGNADAYGYERDCVGYWQNFEPYKDYFLDVVLISDTWIHHWVSIAQVLWAHFRWSSGEDWYDNFSLEAAYFFMQNTLDLPLTLPIHYYDFWEIAPHSPYWDDQEQEIAGKKAVLVSTHGVLYFYYAQILHYHLQDYDKARLYYHQFIAAEPTLLPDNNYELFRVAKEQRMYPPCIQAAYTALGQTYEATKDFPRALYYYQEAIALRPDNHQAPYQYLAAIYEKTGNIEKALAYYQKKLDCCLQTSFKQCGYGNVGRPVAYFEYAPDRREQAVPITRLTYYTYHAIEATWLIDLAVKIAQMTFWELEDFALAQQRYKTCISLLNAHNDPRFFYKSKQEIEDLYALIWEQQALAAFELGDYWQARSLHKKILKIKPARLSSKSALRHLATLIP